MKQYIQEFAEILDVAAKDSKAVEQLSTKAKITLADAYLIQKESIDRRISRSEKITGIKLGFTSKAKMEQMGVHDLIWGRLTNTMEIKNEGVLHLENFIHPRAEPEIAYLVKKDIKTSLTREEALEYIESVAPAIEIIDSRYKNFKFSLEDVIADNCSSSAYVIGAWKPADTDVSNVDLTLNINGETVESGNTNAILGNPLESFLEATRLAFQYGISLKKGMVILAGAATSAAFIKKNDAIEADFKMLGKVTLSVQ
ncbi:MAG: 2-keto-4-pentenoate hydratase [Flavobacteriales bacterium]